MAKGQYLSKHQQGIVRRHYEHADTRTLAKLQEMVSDLYVASDAKSAEKLWAKVGELLAKAAANEGRVQRIMETRDMKLLAALVGELAGPGRK
jgi:hypothetical protein